MPQNLSAQAQKFWISMKKGLNWASVVGAFCKIRLQGCANTLIYLPIIYKLNNFCNNFRLNEKPTTYVFETDFSMSKKIQTSVRHLKSIKETSEKLSPPCKRHSKATKVKYLHFNHLFCVILKIT